MTSTQTPFEALKADFETLSSHVLTLAKAANNTADGIETMGNDLVAKLEAKFDAFGTKIDTFETKLDTVLDERFAKFMTDFETRFFGSMDASSSSTVAEVGDLVGQLGSSSVTGGAGNDTITLGTNDLSGKTYADLHPSDTVQGIGGPVGVNDTILGQAGTESIPGVDTIEGSTTEETETGIDPTTGLPASK